jgi:phage-related protein
VVIITTACRRELKKFPVSIRADLADALARLDEGLNLSMPLSRPMPGIGPGVHELRLKDTGTTYRVIYAVVVSERIAVFHAFKKTTRATPKAHLDLARKRLKELKP